MAPAHSEAQGANRGNVHGQNSNSGYVNHKRENSRGDIQQRDQSNGRSERSGNSNQQQGNRSSNKAQGKQPVVDSSNRQQLDDRLRQSWSNLIKRTQGHGDYDLLGRVPSDRPLACALCDDNLAALTPPVEEYHGPVQSRRDGKPIHHLRLPPQDNYEGLVAYLPYHELIPRTSSCWSQWALNRGAYGHPCVVLLTSACRHQVFCVPMGSFKDRPIQGKYAPAHNDTRAQDVEYVALQWNYTKPHNNYHVVDYDGKFTPRQSYIHLDLGFWIEPEYLGQFTQDYRRLTRNGVNYVYRLYRAEERHWVHNARRPMPIDTMDPDRSLKIDRRLFSPDLPRRFSRIQASAGPEPPKDRPDMIAYRQRRDAIPDEGESSKRALSPEPSGPKNHHLRSTVGSSPKNKQY